MSVTRLWAISDGDYSDYSVDFLFPTEAAARKYMAGLLPERDWKIEEFLLLDETEVPIYDTTYCLRYFGQTQGALALNNAWDFVELRTPGNKAPSRRPVSNLYPLSGGRGWGLEVKGPNKKLVQQAASDRVAQLAAEEQGFA